MPAGSNLPLWKGKPQHSPGNASPTLPWGICLLGLLQEEAWMVSSLPAQRREGRHRNFWQVADTWRSKRVARDGTGVHAGPSSPKVWSPRAAGVEQGGWWFLSCCCDQFLFPRAR